MPGGKADCNSLSSSQEVFWIGPTKCDEARAVRENKLINAWRVLASCKGYSDMYLITGSDINLFREALSCYQNGAFMATIIMCGVALESLLYDLVSAIKGEAEISLEGFIYQVRYDEAVYKLSFGRLMKEAKDAGLVDGKLEKEMNEIRHWRNLVAHYRSRLRRELSKQFKKQFHTDSSRSSIQLPIWASGKEAYDVLEKTAEIMCILINKAYSILRCSRKRMSLL